MSQRIQTKEQRQKQVISRLKADNQKLRARVKYLEEQLVIKDQIISDMLLRLSELEQIIFGKKKKKDDKSDDDSSTATGGNATKDSGRDKSSYARPTPTAGQVTEITEHKIDHCPDCGTTLTKKQIITRYIEDIRLACAESLSTDDSLADHKQIKQVIEQHIEKGYCPNCKHWHAAIPIVSSVVTVGPKVKIFVAYAINILRLSYEQTKNILFDLHGFTISDGEIANLLERTADKLNPELERLKQRILQAKSVHLDETGHQTGVNKNYTWVLASGETEEAVFLIGKNRGKGNAVDLLQDYAGIRVTDCYPGYKNMSGTQQVCWSHLIRKLRDLKDNANLEESKRGFVIELYGEMAELFAQVKTISESKYVRTKRLKMLPELKNNLDIIIKKILSATDCKIKKLTDLAKQLQTYKDQCFTCIVHEGVDPTNNKAERKIRHLVLKRKNSFGTKTEKGNRVLEINMSVLLSLWWNSRTQFFARFGELMGV